MSADRLRADGGAGARAPVVVGVDGSPAGLAAVELATAEAVRRDRPLRIVYADPWARHPAWVDVVPEGSIADELAAQPEQVLAAARARAGDCPVPVSVAAIAGAPVRVLLHESGSAALLVVGQRGLGGVGGMLTAGLDRIAGLAGTLLGSVALRLAVHAGCPVLVARSRADGIPATDGPVLVGVDGSPAGDAALGFAFEEAALCAAALLAVHTWIGPVVEAPGEVMPVVYDPAQVAAEERRVLVDALAGWQEKYPGVRVDQALVHSRAPGTLVEASHRARLAVIGARGRGGLPGLPLGTVTHALLHHAACPVAVVHHPVPR